MLNWNEVTTFTYLVTLWTARVLVWGKIGVTCSSLHFYGLMYHRKKMTMIVIAGIVCHLFSDTETEKISK